MQLRWAVFVLAALLIGCSAKQSSVASDADSTAEQTGGTAVEGAETQADDPYSYLVSVVEALGYAKSALGHRDDGTSPGSSGEYKALVMLKLAKSDFERAASFVAPYEESSNDTIRISAEAMKDAFAQLASLSGQTVEQFKQLLDDQSGDIKPGTALERQAELAISFREAWKGLYPATVMATYSVIRFNPETGTMSGLALTEEQRDDLLESLGSTFGKEISKGISPKQSQPGACAVALSNVIGDPERQLISTE